MLTGYLVTQIGKPFAATLLIAGALFASYGAANFLQQATNGLLASNQIIYMVGFKLLIALEIIVPVALFLSIIVAFGKMYENAEFQAIPALRFGPGQILRSLLTIAFPVALCVAFLSLVVRPWAFGNLHHIERNAALNVDLTALLSNVFYAMHGGKRIVYINRKPGGGAQNIFVFENHEPRYLKILTARKGYVVGETRETATSGAGTWVHFRDGQIFELGLLPDVADKIVQIQQANQNPLGQPLGRRSSYTPTETSTWGLLAHDGKRTSAEIEWRLATGVSALFLALLALPLAKSGPRQGGAGRVGLAIAIYFVYFGLFTVAKNAVQNGIAPAWIGLWWAPAILAFGTGYLLWRFFTEGFISFGDWARGTLRDLLAGRGTVRRS